MDRVTSSGQSTTDTKIAEADEEEEKVVRDLSIKLVKVKELQRNVEALMAREAEFTRKQRRRSLVALEAGRRSDLIRQWEALKEEITVAIVPIRRPSVVALAKQKKSAEIIRKIEVMIMNNLGLTPTTSTGEPEQPAATSTAPPKEEGDEDREADDAGEFMKKRAALQGIREPVVQPVRVQVHQPDYQMDARMKQEAKMARKAAAGSSTNRVLAVKHAKESGHLVSPRKLPALPRDDDRREDSLRAMMPKATEDVHETDDSAQRPMATGREDERKENKEDEIGVEEEDDTPLQEPLMPDSGVEAFLSKHKERSCTVSTADIYAQRRSYAADDEEGAESEAADLPEQEGELAGPGTAQQLEHANNLEKSGSEWKRAAMPTPGQGDYDDADEYSSDEEREQEDGEKVIVKCRSKTINRADVPPPATMEGWLVKGKEGRFPHWQKRWFLLDYPFLKYFTSANEKQLKGFISVRGGCMVDTFTHTSKNVKRADCTFRINGGDKMFLLEAASPKEKKEWMVAIWSNVFFANPAKRPGGVAYPVELQRGAGPKTKPCTLIVEVQGLRLLDGHTKSEMWQRPIHCVKSITRPDDEREKWIIFNFDRYGGAVMLVLPRTTTPTTIFNSVQSVILSHVAWRGNPVLKGNY